MHYVEEKRHLQRILPKVTEFSVHRQVYKLDIAARENAKQNRFREIKVSSVMQAIIIDCRYAEVDLPPVNRRTSPRMLFRNVLLPAPTDPTIAFWNKGVSDRIYEAHVSATHTHTHKQN